MVFGDEEKKLTVEDTAKRIGVTEDKYTQMVLEERANLIGISPEEMSRRIKQVELMERMVGVSGQ